MFSNFVSMATVAAFTNYDWHLDLYGVILNRSCENMYIVVAVEEQDAGVCSLRMYGMQCHLF